MADQGSNSVAQLAIGDRAIDLPILDGNEGPQVIDVGRLTSEGYFTYDPGFVSTASCESSITYIDGDQGVLLHRGYPIEQLAREARALQTGQLQGERRRWCCAGWRTTARLVLPAGRGDC